MSILGTGYPYEPHRQPQPNPEWQTQLNSRQQYRLEAEETMKAAREILSISGITEREYEKARVLIKIAEIYMSWSESS